MAKTSDGLFLFLLACLIALLGTAPGQRVWAYRKAAWAIEDLEVDIGLLYRQMGRKGLESIDNVGPRLAEAIEALIDEPR